MNIFFFFTKTKVLFILLSAARFFVDQKIHLDTTKTVLLLLSIYLPFSLCIHSQTHIPAMCNSTVHDACGAPLFTLWVGTGVW